MIRRPEIAVIGPGAIGATIAAELMRAGHEPLLCGRTERSEVIVDQTGHDPMSLLAAASDGW